MLARAPRHLFNCHAAMATFHPTHSVEVIAKVNLLTFALAFF